MNRPPQNLSQRTIKKEVFDSFVMVTKTTSSRTHPIAFCQIILSQNNLFMHEPHKHFDSQRYLYFPNVLRGRNDARVYDVQVHGFDREHAVLS